MTRNQILPALRGGLIVSCQALPSEPLHSPYIMSRMAVAARDAGAKGIRANSVEDIMAIRRLVSLPMIGIIKREYQGSPVYITPTLREVEALVACGVEIIALDATNRVRPGGHTLRQAFREIRQRYPDQLFMADCATYEEAAGARELGFDLAGTTLCGYTEETEGTPLPNMELMRRLGADLSLPIIAEGGIWTPGQLGEILRMPGIHAAVVGSAITRPYEITRHFLSGIAQ